MTQTTLAATPAPFEKMDFEDSGYPVYKWLITDDEARRLSALFKRDFTELGMSGTFVTTPPKPCVTCGKWTEFIDWVYTALQRNIHGPDFMFNALKNKQMPKENRHDVYCSGCGTLTHCRAESDREGQAANVFLAGNMDKARAATHGTSEDTAPTRWSGDWMLMTETASATHWTKTWIFTKAESIAPTRWSGIWAVTSLDGGVKMNQTSGLRNADAAFWIPSNPWFAFKADASSKAKFHEGSAFWIPSVPWFAFKRDNDHRTSPNEGSSWWTPNVSWIDYVKDQIAAFVPVKREESSTANLWDTVANNKPIAIAA